MFPCDVPRGYDSVTMLPAALLYGVLIILLGVKNLVFGSQFGNAQFEEQLLTEC